MQNFRKKYFVYLSNLINKSLVKNVSYLSIGNAIGRCIHIAFLPILTYVYTQENYGQYAFFTSTSAFIGYCLTLQLDKAILLPKKHKEASIIARILITYSIVFILIGSFILNWFDFFKHRTTPMYIAIASCLLGIELIAQQWNIRKKQFKTLATASWCMPLAFCVAAMINATVLHIQTNGLLFAYIFSYIVSILILSAPNNKSNFFRKPKLKDSFGIFIKIIKKYIKFPIYTLPASLMFLSLFALPFWILGGTPLFQKELGIYGLVDKMILTPAYVALIPLGSVIGQKMSEYYNHKPQKCYLLYKKAFLFLLFATIIMYLTVYILTPIIIPLILAPTWHKSVGYVQILSIGLAGKTILWPLEYSFNVLKKQHLYFINKAMLIVACLIGLYISKATKNFTDFLKFFAICEFIISLSFSIVGLVLFKKFTTCLIKQKDSHFSKR